MISMQTPKDVITGESIKMECLGMNDGEYTWFNILAYYVKKYNLRLPEEFERKILNSKVSFFYRKGTGCRIKEDSNYASDRLK